MNLYDYINKHAVRCLRNDGDADLIFFSMRKGPEATVEGLRAAIDEHGGHHCDVDLFDGKEHSYLELGAWLGDQGAALMLIGLGAALGMWQLLTPRTVLGKLVDEKMVQEMAGMGLVCMQVKP
jgi:hypothetical protein